MNNENEENKVVYLRLDDIIPNRFQPREVFDETGLEELADSIREHGIIQPIIVRQIGDKYELIAGERRSKASAMAGLTTIPAIVRNMDDRESAKVSLLENLQRKNLSAIEEARTYKKILELEEMTQEDLARTMGKSQPLIANKLRLLSLPEEVQDALIKNQISERHARSLLNVKNKEEQLNLLNRVRNERLTVRELDGEIKKLSQSSIPSTNATPTYDPESSGSRGTYNNFNDAYKRDFNNMGLNDYQTQVGSNLFNNIPDNNGAQTTNFFNQNYMSNDMNSMSKQDYQIENNFNQKKDNFNQGSLGSMFDNTNMNQVNTNNNYQEFDESAGQNVFISHIKEDVLKPKENQFLPNFNDDVPSNSFSNEFTSFSNGNQFDNNQGFNSFSNNLENNNSSQNIINEPMNNNNYNYNIDNNMSNFSYQDNQNYKSNQVNNGYEQPMNDFNFSSFSQNQGGLFNQPLNIVEVPKQASQENYSPKEEPVSKGITLEQEIADEKKERESFDNPLDDPYENILFAKPVPIQIEEEKEEHEDIELIDEDVEGKFTDIKEEVKENQYISLEPEKTIFDVKGAVLELKKTTDNIKSNGFNIETEEINFDDVYQIIIKIKK